MSEQPGAPPAEPAKPHHQSFWLWVMCLTGVDYFSTLGYQPSIAYQNAGLLAPLATVVLVLVTLFGALPIYAYVAKRSFEGQGSIGMLAKLVSGWPGKIMVLVLLGFAATGFVITKTLSAADAAVHLIENPNWPWKPEPGVAPTGQLIAVDDAPADPARAAMFMRGFREVIGLAVGDRRGVPGAEPHRPRRGHQLPDRPPGEVARVARAARARRVVPGAQPARLGRRVRRRWSPSACCCSRNWHSA